MEFRDRVVWLAGATGAIGRAIAPALVREGAHVVLSARTASALEGLEVELVARSPGAATALTVDLGERAAVDAAAQRILHVHGRIDMLVNSTAVSLFGDFLELDDTDWETVYRNKLFAYVRTIRAVLPAMVARRYGRIVNVSGRGGHQPTTPVHLPGMTANASVNLLTKGLANAYATHGIRANAVAPGPVASPRYDAIASANAHVADRLPPAEAGGAGIGVTAPYVQRAQPADIADVVVYLLSDRSRLLNGVVLQADGGSTASL